MTIRNERLRRVPFALLPSAVPMLALIFVTRLPALAAFPLFIDETVHLSTAETVLRQSSPLFQVWLGRQFTIWWFALFQAPFAAPAWVARAATLLAVMIGAAALLALAYRLGGRWALSFYGRVYAFSAFHLFFERLALADNIAGAALLLAVMSGRGCERAWRRAMRCFAACCCSSLLGRRRRRSPYFGIPLAAVLALTPRERPHAHAALAGIGARHVLGLTAMYVVIVRLRGMDVLGNSLSLAVSNRGSADTATIFSPARLPQNALLRLRRWRHTGRRCC